MSEVPDMSEVRDQSTGEVIEELAREGLPATIGKTRRAILVGECPQPAMDGAGNYRWTRAHVDALRKYLTTPRRAGRKPRRHPPQPVFA